MSVTGDLLIDFTGEADANPYTNAEFTVGGGNLKVLSGAIKSAGGAAGFYSADAPTDTTVTAKITVNGSHPSGDPIGPALLDASGNGYWLRCHYSETRIWTVADWSPVSLLGGSGGGALLANEDCSIKIDEATNQITTYKNGVQIEQITDATYSGLRAGFFYSADNTDAAGATHWAADGYATATDTITPDGTIEVGGSANFTYTGFASGAINAGDLGGQTLSVSGSTITLEDSFNVPDGTVVSPLGSQAINLGNGTETAASTMTVTLPTGITETTMATVDTATPLSMYALLLTVGKTLTTGDKIRFDSSDGSTLTDAGIYDWSLPKYFTYINSSNQAYNYRLMLDGTIESAWLTRSLPVSIIRSVIRSVIK